MANYLMNEGRVVGYSAYEIYVKHALTNDPNTSPASEGEWLSSMLGLGSSMLLRVGIDENRQQHYIDVPMPEHSRLCAANVILASLFLGTGYVENDNDGTSTAWCSKVESYGNLIANTESRHPSEDGSEIPTTFGGDLSQSDKRKIIEYMKIRDGIIIQPGTWMTNDNQPPYEDYQPNLSTAPTLRLLIEGQVEEEFYILLTGFTNKDVVYDSSEMTSSVHSTSPDDGDFLGPWVFPWSAKVIFSIPSAYMYVATSGGYTRELTSGTSEKHVAHSTVLDFDNLYNSAYDNTFYDTEFADSPISVTVTGYDNKSDDLAVIAAHIPYTTIDETTYRFPPSMYCGLINVTGEMKYFPIDTVAPGTVKIMDDKDIDYINAMDSIIPNIVSGYRDTTDYVWYQADSTFNSVPVSNDTYVSIFGSLRSEEFLSPMLVLQKNVGNRHDYINIVGNRRMYGYLGPQFIEEFTITETQKNAILRTVTKGASWSSVIRNNYQASKLDTRNTYKYLLYTQEPNASANYWEILPIRIEHDSNGDEIGYIDFISRYYCSDVPIEWDYDTVDWESITPPQGWTQNPIVYLPVEDDPKYTTAYNNTALFGSWWENAIPFNMDDNATNEYKSIHSKMKDIVDDRLSNITGIKIVESPDRYLPSNKYNNKTYDDYIDMYKNTTLTEVAVVAGNTNMNDWIHPSLASGTLYTLTDKARLYSILPNDSEDELTPITTEFNGKTIQGRGINFYVVPNVLIENRLRTASNLEIYGTEIALKNLDDNEAVTGDIIPKSSLTDSDKVFLFEIIHPKYLQNFKTYLTESNAYKTVLIDVPNKYQIHNSPQAALGQSGTNQTMSIAICKEDGSPCNLWGTNGVVPFNELDHRNIVWKDLVQALYDGKSIDLLGDALKSLQTSLNGSGTNFIEFKNGLRLYISDSQPTGNIPNGSIGIGW